MEIFLRIKALTLCTCMSHFTLFFKKSHLTCLLLPSMFVWTIGQSFRPLNQSCWIGRGWLLVHVVGYAWSPDYLFKAGEPCTVWSSTGTGFCLLCGEMEFWFTKTNLISHCEYILKIACNYETELVFSLHYLNFLFILTRIALLVCSEILMTLGRNGEVLFCGKECNKESCLLTTPSTVMQSPFFHFRNSPSTVPIDERYNFLSGWTKLKIAFVI